MQGLSAVRCLWGHRVPPQVMGLAAGKAFKGTEAFLEISEQDRAAQNCGWRELEVREEVAGAPLREVGKGFQFWPAEAQLQRRLWDHR